MVLIADHIIIIHHLDVMLHIYNTLDKIQVALAANLEGTNVMMRFDLNPPRWTKGAPTQLKQSQNIM